MSNIDYYLAILSDHSGNWLLNIIIGLFRQLIPYYASLLLLLMEANISVPGFFSTSISCLKDIGVFVSFLI